MAFADELALLDATAQAELVDRGQVKAIERVDAPITRVERVTPALNAVVTPMYDEARRHALAEPAGHDVVEAAPALPLMRAALWVPFTPICNITGQPVMAVPTYWTAEGLPVGTRWIGHFGDESTLFHLAAQLEAARPSSRRRARISA